MGGWHVFLAITVQSWKFPFILQLSSKALYDDMGVWKPRRLDERPDSTGMCTASNSHRVGGRVG